MGHPGEVTEDVFPTCYELVAMVQHAGAAIALLARLGHASALEALRAVIESWEN